MTDKEFFDWLIDYIFECDENDEEVVAEVICRKLIKAGKLKRVEIDGVIYQERTDADVRDDATAHKVVGGGEHDGATCWFECDNCGLAVDIGDVFCKHCGARFVP